MSFEADLVALLSQPWSEGACRGYVISAMERCGFKPADIQQVMINIVNIIFTKNVNLKITRNVNLLLPVLLTYVYLFRPFLVFQHIHKILGSI